ncbi:MAG TPA: nitrogen regulation protein NR(II) [Azoarcus sp.]|nr:nitrogen regulation protein NR(II) [Azoarcus sp.]
MPDIQPHAPLPNPFAGLDLLSSAVVLTDAQRRIRYMNASAENLFAISQRKLLGAPLFHLIGASATLDEALNQALHQNWSYTGQDIQVTRPGNGILRLDCTVTPADAEGIALLLEFRPIDAQLRVAREEQLLQQQRANRELIRNLAHEIKNPLGGIRGSAQLLKDELDDPQLREFTEVIIAEADRLQDLLNRMLSSHNAMRPTPLNIHEILERVRKLILAEFPGVTIRRDYDISLPNLTADPEQLIQSILNIVRNAAQAINGHGEIHLRTRIARQVTLAKRRFLLALELQIIDNGPGIPEEICSKIFYPLVSGSGGSGLGLSIAQGFIEQHQGMIDVQSQPGRTCFTVLLPISNRSL